MEDGFVLFYVKDNKVLPVLLTEQQHEMFNIVIPNMLGGETVKVIDKPQGEAFNLKEAIK